MVAFEGERRRYSRDSTPGQVQRESRARRWRNRPCARGVHSARGCIVINRAARRVAAGVSGAKRSVFVHEPRHGASFAAQRRC